ncbi:hypothetical protein BaRGS_00030004 [Batillaria attramentaria]|uniref:Uncharacterized protein n=1 Tax=Batillaria attramentaria TaxID=370345 RepID=A0ABD0JVB3_9CAEN
MAGKPEQESSDMNDLKSSVENDCDENTHSDNIQLRLAIYLSHFRDIATRTVGTHVLRHSTLIYYHLPNYGAWFITRKALEVSGHVIATERFHWSSPKPLIATWRVVALDRHSLLTGSGRRVCCSTEEQHRPPLQETSAAWVLGNFVSS